MLLSGCRFIQINDICNSDNDILHLVKDGTAWYNLKKYERRIAMIGTKNIPVGLSQKELDDKSYKNKNVLQSVKCASRGVKACYEEERNFRDYTIIASVFLFFNILLGSELWEYILFFSLAAGAFSAEFLNTAIERIIDTYFNEISETNRFIKDTAAAGVLIIGMAFFLSQALILIPKLMVLLK